MTFLQKAREGLHKLMVGRRGPDELTLALLIAGLVSAWWPTAFPSTGCFPDRSRSATRRT